MITISIDVTKLDKARFKQGKNGQKYCDLVLFENRVPDRYGNTHIVKQSATKEERAAKVMLPIVGNGKDWGMVRKVPQEPDPTPDLPKVTEPSVGEDVPF